MLQKLTALICIVLFLIGCNGVTQNERVKTKRRLLKNTIELGDNIFEAKETLISEGFSIQFGPDFPTANKDYYLMVVDFGEKPNVAETAKYVTGISGSDRSITGVVKADKDGTITAVD